MCKILYKKAQLSALFLLDWYDGGGGGGVWAKTWAQQKIVITTR